MLLTLPVSAQNLLNVYRNDGTVSQYQVSELDSIGFGEIATPSAIDLRQSPCLPNIMQQGSVGCCASASITYMMYSNAYARYMQNLYPETISTPHRAASRCSSRPNLPTTLGEPVRLGCSKPSRSREFLPVCIAISIIGSRGPRTMRWRKAGRQRPECGTWPRISD